jgi:hypothetical protein
MNVKPLMLSLLAALWTSSAFAADVVPAPDSRAPVPPGQSQGDQPKAESSPPVTDPGIVKQPETVPDPNSVVNPPVVDPKMAINPEAGPHQPAGPPERSNQQEPTPKKQ